MLRKGDSLYRGGKTLESLIERFAQISSNGSGSGSGNGIGSGYGNGYGSGYGNGYGNGYGSGNGNGDGCGYGSGYNRSSGIKAINGQAVYTIDYIPTIITAVFGNIAKGYIVESNLYLRPCYIAKGNDCFAHGETIRKAQQALENKIYAGMDSEEVIEKFKEQFELGKEYPAKEFYHWHYRLTGSCEMGRKSFAESHGIDIEHDVMTVERFIELTKDSFGGSIIRQLDNAYKEQQI